MPRSLAFTFSDSTFSCELKKIDRSKLYGTVRVETLDSEGRQCELATLAIDGRTLIPYGGTAAAYVNADGDWISRKDLTAVDLDGKPLPEVESSFDQEIALAQTATEDEFLDHSVRLVYLLKPDSDLSPALLESLREGHIYRFGFSYRGGIDTDPAFIMMDDEETLWMLIGEENDVQFVGLEQAAVCATTQQVDANEAEQDDELDFGML